MILLDTHVLLWHRQNPARLGRHARRRIEGLTVADGLAISAISFWEIGLLLDDSHIRLGQSLAAWRRELAYDQILELPVDGDIALRAGELMSWHRDPADRLILATAAVKDATLMTADQTLLNCGLPIDFHDATQ